VNKPTESSEKVNKPAQDDSSPINEVAYIPFGVAFILLLLLSAVIGFWCYRKSRHKQLKRFFHHHHLFALSKCIQEINSFVFFVVFFLFFCMACHCYLTLLPTDNLHCQPKFAHPIKFQLQSVMKVINDQVTILS